MKTSYWMQNLFVKGPLDCNLVNYGEHAIISFDMNFDTGNGELCISTNRPWSKRTDEEKKCVYDLIDESNKDYMKAISAPSPIFGDWYHYREGNAVKRDIIGYGVTAQNWCPL